MIRNTKGGRWIFTVLAASAALTAGCVRSVDADDLPGVYRNSDTGAEVALGSDGTFTVTGVSPDEYIGVGGTDPVDFSGRWEFLDDRAGSDVVYLTVDAGGVDRIGGVQLYPTGDGQVEFIADPDAPPSLTLTKVDGS
ncbi:hypothetical protein [Streptomyces marincola]|uniref:hypothetical protein n=1 Tax=Streptomyces marincola TaxID=2878388 RepID=UPI001CF5EBAD|nr:hypothetical protein [Streptomyces marincola]UCM87539.1 hypothetical protein LC193_06025 [Streptomyces marincola]